MCSASGRIGARGNRAATEQKIRVRDSLLETAVALLGYHILPGCSEACCATAGLRQRSPRTVPGFPLPGSVSPGCSAEWEGTWLRFSMHWNGRNWRLTRRAKGMWRGVLIPLLEERYKPWPFWAVVEPIRGAGCLVLTAAYR